MALSKQEQAAQAHLNALDKAYKAAFYASPRDEAACLALAQARYEHCKGTHLEEAMLVAVQRHERRLRHTAQE